MDTLRVQAALLRTNLPELVLRPGLMLPGRVLERAGSHGILLLAGTPLSAELPDELQPGARLRLRVEEGSADRVVLRAVEQAAPARGTPPAPPPAGPPPPRPAPSGAGAPRSRRAAWPRPPRPAAGGASRRRSPWRTTRRRWARSP